jgi:hypothetical protein
MYSYKEVSEFPEHGDFDILYALKGMLPETLHLASAGSKFWEYLRTLPIKSNDQAFNVSRSSSPSRDRQINIAQPRPVSHTKPDMPLVLFSYREHQVYR